MEVMNMQIQHTSNTNFQGGFRFVNMKTTAREQLPNIFKKGKQIFYDFERKGDVFLLTRPEKDYAVAKFIDKHNLKFEYYPEISTTTRALDCEIHEPLTEMLEELNPKVITSKKDMFASIKANLKEVSLANKTLTSAIEPSTLEVDSSILSKLGIDIENSTHEVKDGLHIISGNGVREKAFVTPPSKNGFKYVMYVPESYEQDVKRYAVTSEGAVLAEFNTPTEILQFKRNVSATLHKDI